MRVWPLTNLLEGTVMTQGPIDLIRLAGDGNGVALTEWQECLDALDAGRAITWRDAVRGPALSIERDDSDERLSVTIRDDVTTMTTVTVMVPLEDSWFDDAYDRLEQVRSTWPPTCDAPDVESA